MFALLTIRDRLFISPERKTQAPRNSQKPDQMRSVPVGKVPRGTLQRSDCQTTTSEGEPERVLKFSTSIRLCTHNTWPSARRAVLDLECVCQRSGRLSGRVEELWTCRGVDGIKAYPDSSTCAIPGITEIGMVKEIEGIHPELSMDALGNTEVL